MKSSKLVSKITLGIFSLITLLNVPSVWAVQPYNMPIGVTDISNKVFGLHMTVFYVCCVIGAVVFTVMFYSMFKHRKSKGHRAADFHESTLLEFIWTVIPFIILISLAIPATKVLIAMEDTSKADITIKVTGYQWMWRYEYLDHGIDFYSMLSTPRDEIYNKENKNQNYLLEVDNELVLPTNRKVRILITSNDVLHAWWIPELAVKKDAIPGYINQVWTNIEKPGVYRGQCAELCGRDHGFMPVVVRAVPPGEFNQWLADKNTGTTIAATNNKKQVLANLPK